MQKSTKQNNSVTINISGESGDLAVNTPENLEVSTHPDKLFQTKKVLQRFSGNLVQGVFKLSEKATEIGQGAAKSATEIGQGAAKSATEIGQGAAKSATEIGQGAAKSATEIGQGVAKSATEIGQGAAKSATEIGQEALRFFGNNTQASQDAKEASVRAHIKRVNLASVKKSVSALKEKFPSKTSEEIAHQVVLQKTLQMTGNASAINMIPGKLAESMGFDQAALVATQVETVYQIAEAYKLDLSTSERREEALAIFDRAYRSFRKKKMSINVGSVPTLSLVEGGLSLIPLLGPFLGGALNVGSDSFLSFLIGDIACQLYKEIVAETSPGAALRTFSQETQTQYKQRLW
jgi:uncharacterized protein (DUF697 family)